MAESIETPPLTGADKLTAAGLVLGLGLVIAMILCPDLLSWIASEVAAAWVQAFGSIAALAVALWLSRSGERERKERAFRAGRIYGQQLMVKLKEAVEACEKEDGPRLVVMGDILTALQALAHDVPIADLSMSKIDSFMRLRAINSEAGWIVRTVGSQRAAYRPWSGTLERLRVEAEKQVDEYRA